MLKIILPRGNVCHIIIKQSARAGYHFKAGEGIIRGFWREGKKLQKTLKKMLTKVLGFDKI